MPRRKSPSSFEQAIQARSKQGLTDRERGRALGLTASLFELLEGVARGKGAADKAREIARKLLEHGVAWDIVSEATGVLPEDLGEAKA
jgi:hypothetical protein